MSIPDPFEEYETAFGTKPFMPYPMPFEEYTALVKEALKSGVPIVDDTPEDVLT